MQCIHWAGAPDHPLRASSSQAVPNQDGSTIVFPDLKFTSELNRFSQERIPGRPWDACTPHYFLILTSINQLERINARNQGWFGSQCQFY